MMSLLNSMPHKCTIQKRVRTKGTLGGSKDTATIIRQDVECWEQQLNSSEVSDYQKQGIRADRKVFFVSDPSVGRRSQILITERFGETVTNPEVLDVVNTPIPDASAGLDMVWRVVVRYTTSRDD